MTRHRSVPLYSVRRAGQFAGCEPLPPTWTTALGRYALIAGRQRSSFPSPSSARAAAEMRPDARVKVHARHVALAVIVLVLLWLLVSVAAGAGNVA